ncbi:methyltransferase domain-containing protein [Streptomyces sp. A7024]|uniref:Methyltransferase domain-containing protein n=1 Tax=Streptomyces coryli TaxID=1128680 RepID=A0A6G4TVS8_9ACTN|nr:class I SAM-dependent methyltransferase [Streptomyces coryli]NGN63546.1 methyltransferase domain-containing protein [Streptomyces coryli]
MDRHEWAAGVVAARGGDRVLEVGCGHGVTASHVLAGLGEDGRLLGVDRSAKMTAAAGRRNEAEVAAGRAEFRTAEWPVDLGDERYDAVYSFSVQLLTADVTAARAVRDVLAPGGRFFAFYQLPPWKGVTQAGVVGAAARVLHDAGLVVVRDAHELGVEAGCVVARGAGGG